MEADAERNLRSLRRGRATLVGIVVTPPAVYGLFRLIYAVGPDPYYDPMSDWANLLFVWVPTIALALGVNVGIMCLFHRTSPGASRPDRITAGIVALIGYVLGFVGVSIWYINHYGTLG